VFSPDGTRLAFTSAHKVYVADQFAQDPELVLDIGAGAYGLDWSPDGTQLVGSFPNCADHDCEPDLYVFGADGTGLTNLTNSFDPEYNPSWSPDGSKIAFDSVRAGQSDVFTIDADGGNLDNLTGDVSAVAAQPDWSPDASRLAFEVHVPTHSASVWTANADGSGKQQEFTAQLGTFQPAWSPDGSRFAYRDRGSDAIRVTGPHPSFYTAAFGAPGQEPDWQPRPPDPSPPPANGSGYVRPAAAPAVRVPLVPRFTFAYCAEGSQHGPPLAHKSCSPDVSPYAVGTPDVNGEQAVASGFVRFSVVGGDPGTSEDEADVRIRVRQTDVRRATNPPTEAPGTMVVHATLRITDQWNDGGDADPTGTVLDHPLYIATPCVSTLGPEGAACAVDTTADAITPGLVREGRRTVWDVGQVRAYVTEEDPHLVDREVSFAQGIYVP
jgi:Tol biopolymer transport system component